MTKTKFKVGDYVTPRKSGIDNFCHCAIIVEAQKIGRECRYTLNWVGKDSENINNIEFNKNEWYARQLKKIPLRKGGVKWKNNNTHAKTKRGDVV